MIFSLWLSRLVVFYTMWIVTVVASNHELVPYYSEYAPVGVFVVDNSTLKPIPSTTGIAFQSRSAGKITQFHTHINFQYPEKIRGGDCLCQLAFRISPDTVRVSSDDASLDVFNLKSPTTKSYHPPISGYQGRWIARELVPGSGVAYVEFGMQPFACSALAGQVVGYEISPKWWDDGAFINVTWSGVPSNLYGHKKDTIPFSYVSGACMRGNWANRYGNE